MVGLFKNLDRKQVFSWALYDFANSAYAIIILSFVFPIFYREVIAGAKLGDFYWGLIGSISILLGGIASPIIGAIADEHKRKKSKFIFLVLISITGTGLLYFTGSGTLLLASIIFIIANLSFEIAQTLYDSFLSQISTKDTIGRISGFAWGLGYLGGAITLLLFKPLYGAGHEANEQLYRLTFPLTALFFLVFSLPAFFFLREQIEKSTISTGQLIKKGLGRVASTLKSFRNYKRIAWFMFGFYLFNDALVTLFAFMPLFAKVTIRMDITEIAILLLGAQVLAFPFTFLFGWLSDKTGAKPILLITLLGWAVITFLLYIGSSKEMFYVVSFIAALVMGSSQATARSWLAKMIPDEKRTEFFGFNGFASKIAATTGPLVFGSISSFTGNQRNGVIAMLPFFILAFIIFARIKEQKD